MLLGNVACNRSTVCCWKNCYLSSRGTACDTVRAVTIPWRILLNSIWPLPGQRALFPQTSTLDPSTNILRSNGFRKYLTATPHSRSVSPIKAANSPRRVCRKGLRIVAASSEWMDGQWLTLPMYKKRCKTNECISMSLTRSTKPEG